MLGGIATLLPSVAKATVPEGEPLSTSLRQAAADVSDALSNAAFPGQAISVKDISGLALEATKVNAHTLGSVGLRDGAGNFELPPLSGGLPSNCSTSDVLRIVWAQNPSATTPASMWKTVLRLRLLSEHATSRLLSPT